MLSRNPFRSLDLTESASAAYRPSPTMEKGPQNSG
jgi:hypothetical protein